MKGKGVDKVASAALYLSLHLTALGAVHTLPPETHLPIARIATTASFATAQQAAGIMPFDSYLISPTNAKSNQPRHHPALSGLGAGTLAYVALAAVPAGLLTASGEPELARVVIPHPFLTLTPLLLVDTLVLAPLAEEIFFRAWMLACMEEEGVPEAVAISVSALLFGVWHVGTDGIASITLLGGWLGFVYINSGKSLLVPIIAHMTWNVLSLAVPSILG